MMIHPKDLTQEALEKQDRIGDSYLQKYIANLKDEIEECTKGVIGIRKEFHKSEGEYLRRIWHAMGEYKEQRRKLKDIGVDLDWEDREILHEIDKINKHKLEEIIVSKDLDSSF